MDYLKSFTVKNTQENHSKLDLELIKLIMKAKKYKFGLTYRKDYIEDNLKVSFCFSVPVVKYKDFEYIATLTRENPKLAQQNLNKKKVHMDTCTKVDEEDIHKIDETARGNQVVASEEYKEENFKKYFKAGFHCDHCRKNRFRLKVYLFKNPKNKSLMISTACSKEYFGVSIDTMLRNIKAQLEGLEKYCHKAEQRSFAWEANRFDTPSYCTRIYETSVKHRMRDIKEKTKKYNHKDFLTFWKSKEAKNPADINIHNINVALTQFQPQTYFLNKAVWGYIKEVCLYKDEIVKPKTNGEYKVGDRIDDEGKIILMKEKYGAYGAYYFYIVRASKGHRIGFSTGQNVAGSGDKVKFDGMVKGFGDWKGETTVFCNKVFCKAI